MSLAQRVHLRDIAATSSAKAARSTLPTEPAITEDMISAGLRVLRDAGISQEFIQADKLVLAEIFRVMYEAATPTVPFPARSA
jgi:hypothetical protein